MKTYAGTAEELIENEEIIKAFEDKKNRDKIDAVNKRYESYVERFTETIATADGIDVRLLSHKALIGILLYRQRTEWQ